MESRRVVMEDLSRYGEAVDGEEKAVYLAPFHHCEVNLARRLLQLREQQGFFPWKTGSRSWTGWRGSWE